MSKLYHFSFLINFQSSELVLQALNKFAILEFHNNYHGVCHSLSEWFVCFNEPFVPKLKIYTLHLIYSYMFSLGINGSLKPSQKKKREENEKEKK